MAVIVNVDKVVDGSNHEWWTNFYKHYEDELDDDELTDEEWSNTLTEILTEWNGYDLPDTKSFIGFRDEESYMLFLLRWA